MLVKSWTLIGVFCVSISGVESYGVVLPVCFEVVGGPFGKAFDMIQGASWRAMMKDIVLAWSLLFKISAIFYGKWFLHYGVDFMVKKKQNFFRCWQHAGRALRYRTFQRCSICSNHFFLFCNYSLFFITKNDGLLF